ncbi:MAG: efflux RND transporter periplasmic adaptor subunit [Candidatus Acidiferrales bacterium]
MDTKKDKLPFTSSRVNHCRAQRLTVCALGGLLSLAGGFILSGCSSQDQAEAVPTVTVQVGAAESEPIQRVISADAILYPKDQAAIVPKVAAPISKFYVNRGSNVHAGELLVELENRDLTGALTEIQGGYQQAEANYQTVSQQVSQNLKLAKEQLDAQQKLYDSRETLYKQGAGSAKDVQDAAIALTQARDQYALAEKQYELKVAEAQLTAAKGKTASAEAQLSYTKITSPINGVVTDRPFYPGEMSPAGTPILTVMDLSQVVARAHIPQADALQLHAGDSATITVPGGKPVPGKITLVSPALDPGSTTVEVWVQAANPGGTMKPGASVRVAMVAQTVAKAVVIPAESLLTDPDGVTSVIVLDSDNKPHKQKVKTGIRNGDDVQVTDGLKGGERVVTVGAFELANEDEDVLAKTKIQVQAPKMPDEDDEDN